MTHKDLFHETGFPNNVPQPGGTVEAECRALGISPEGVIDFNSCVNPLGPPQCIDAVLADGVRLASLYPDRENSAACAALAKAHNVPPETIIVGNGSTELLYMAVRNLHPEKTLVLGPIHEDMPRAAQLAGSQVELQLAIAGRLFRHDIASLHDVSRYHLVMLASPCNPTGVFYRQGELLEWVAANPETFFLIDEGFIDFVDRPGVSMIGVKCPNVIVIKSLTKFFAIPGLRLGMLWADREVADVMRVRQEPWSVNHLAQRLALDLYNEAGYIDVTRELVRKERSFLIRSLTELGFRVFDSLANFLLLRIEQRGVTSSILKKQLLLRRVLVLDCADVEGLGDQFIRVSVRRHDENERLVLAIDDTLRELASL